MCEHEETGRQVHEEITHLTCFASTKVQILIQKLEASGVRGVGVFQGSGAGVGGSAVAGD